MNIDIETFSSEDLSRSGVYRYAEAPDFRLLLLGVSLDGGPVTVVDTASGEPVPEWFLSALADEDCEKNAFNASFERVCLSRVLRDRGLLPPGAFLSPRSWRCTMIRAACLGLPLSLESAGRVLGLDRQKLAEGKELIRLFCRPGSSGRRNLPVSFPSRWARFREYNRRDVETEMEICRRLEAFPVPDFVWREYELDQRINDRGIRVDLPFVSEAIRMDGISRADLAREMIRLTGLSSPNSVPRLKKWLADRGVRAESVGKKEIAALLETAPPDVRRVLCLRQQLARSSVRKYDAMASAVCRDGRVRGMFQFYGAVRSGRWAGRNVQLQNLPRNTLPDLESARRVVRSGEVEMLRMLYDSVPDVLSELVRTAFIPSPGRKFIVSDYSAVEARVIAWMAGETWRCRVFEGGGDIYCSSASRMFGVPVEKHGVNSHLRQKGKIAELALGYGGGVGALRQMGALEMGIPEEELPQLVSAWRLASPNIVRFWWAVDAAVRKAVAGHTRVSLGSLAAESAAGMLWITLPSGRRLAYPKPRLQENAFGSLSVTYMGLNAARKWERIESYGPKFVENIIQGISRDLLAFAMENLSRDFPVVAHVHDEIILEAPESVSPPEIARRMAENPPWAPGLVLRADAYECSFYRKD